MKTSNKITNNSKLYRLSQWCEKKQLIETQNKIRRIPKKREIWWVSIGENIGYEQNGKNHLVERPVLVYQVFNKHMFFGIPMTSNQKNEKSNYYVKTLHDGVKFYFILPQLRLFSTKRLQRVIRRLEPSEFMRVKNSLASLMHFELTKQTPRKAGVGASL